MKKVRSKIGYVREATREFLEGAARGSSRGLRPYFAVYPESSPRDCILLNDLFRCAVSQSWKNLQALQVQARLQNTQRFSRNTMTKCINISPLFSKIALFMLNNTEILS